MATVRTNLIPSPRYLGSDAVSGGGWAQEDMTAGGPDGGGWTRITATRDIPGGGANFGTDAAGYFDVEAGKTYTGSIYVLAGDLAYKSFRLGLEFRNADDKDIIGGGATGAIVNGLQAGEWQRLDVRGSAPSGAVRARVYVSALASIQTDVAVGEFVGVACRMAEQSQALSDYFDGDSRDTKDWDYAWTGAANASTSTATALRSIITATVLNSSTEPPPVQLVINDVAVGDTYAVTGISSGGRRWEVAGGYGVSEDVQLVLIDNRTPLNVPVRYQLATPKGVYESNTVTVPWAPANGTGKYLVQSLDGRTIVPIAAWQDNQLPRQPELHSAGFAVRGRRRPVMVLAVAGEGTMSVVWRLSRAASTKLDQIIADGGGIALRTDGTARDLPVSDTAVITSASSALWEADNGVSTDRVWDIELTWIDDPEPSTIPVVWDVGEVDALLANETVGEVDALLAGMTVAQVDALDWGTVTP